ncbi:MAG: hypothetical protein HKN43_15315 [Rhodothermales bacterium]|nr:hypothetical protein [Rhodothermales bacterium]
MRIPSLWLLGEVDKSVPTGASVANIQLVDTLGLFDVRVVPDADHDLRDVETGERYDYWSEIFEFIGSM